MCIELSRILDLLVNAQRVRNYVDGLQPISYAGEGTAVLFRDEARAIRGTNGRQNENDKTPECQRGRFGFSLLKR